MARRIVLILALGSAWQLSTAVHAQELLTNGGLELVPPDLGGPDTAPPGWTLMEGPLVPSTTGPVPGDYNQGGVPMIPCPPSGGCGAVDAADYVVWREHLGEMFQLPNEGTGISTGSVTNSDYVFWSQHFGDPPVMDLAQPSNFSHLLFEGDWQLWFEPYNGTEAEHEDNFAHLTQTVPGTPGMKYTMTGWALFEDYFPGGVTNLNAETAGTPTGAPFDDGRVSPTDTFFGLDFLDAGGNVLAFVEKELKADGQPSNTMWTQHTLMAVAPAGTVNVRVRATMLDGVFNPLPEPQIFQQSFFVDAFSLMAAPGSGLGTGVVPEPSTWLLGLAAFSASTTLRNRLRRSRNS